MLALSSSLGGVQSNSPDFVFNFFPIPFFEMFSNPTVKYKDFLKNTLKKLKIKNSQAAMFTFSMFLLSFFQFSVFTVYFSLFNLKC